MWVIIMNYGIDILNLEKTLAPSYRVGIYCRLSKDDLIKDTESASIAHQREMMEEYCSQRGWTIADVYQDDGFTGLNQNRPDFQRLLEDVKARKINLVITKDYSRLGRNHLETEYLREDFFPRNDCRYVAMNDGIDTQFDSEIAPFKAILNEMYSKDISKKVHSSYALQASKGMYTGVVPPLGYLKDPEEKGHLIIDPETAPIIEMIFGYAAEGKGPGYIARRLESQKIPCPTWWNRQRGFRDHYTKWELKDPENGRYIWDTTVLKDILINPVYCGDICSQKKNYRFKLGVLNEKKPEDWVTVTDMHEKIVDRDTFELIQEKIKSRSRPRDTGNYSLFAGLIKCAECGKALTIRNTHAKKPIEIYSCVTYNRYGKHHCTQHRVEYDRLYKILLKEIRGLAKKALKSAEEMAKDLADACAEDDTIKEDVIQRNILRCKERLDTLDRMTARLYEDMLSEKISEDTFDSMMSKVKKEQDTLKEQISEYEKALAGDEEVEVNEQKWIDLIKEYSDIKELDAITLQRLIRAIVVHEEIDDEGTRHISLEIHYNFRPLGETGTHNLTNNSGGEPSPSDN